MGVFLLYKTREWVASPCDETAHEGVDVYNTHPSVINPDYNMIITMLVLIYKYYTY